MNISYQCRLENNDEGLQMPQSSVSLYFREQSLGIWELHIPDDPISGESHRWPIGFVTSGFVRGRLVYLSTSYLPNSVSSLSMQELKVLIQLDF